jgi:hypothetical protein
VLEEAEEFVIGWRKWGTIRLIRAFQFAENSRTHFVNSNERDKEIGTKREEQEHRKQNKTKGGK